MKQKKAPSVTLAIILFAAIALAGLTNLLQYKLVLILLALLFGILLYILIKTEIKSNKDKK